MNQKANGLKIPNHGIMTVIIIIGILIGYVHQMAPSPLMPSLAEYYGIDPVTGQAQLNLSISIMFPFFILSCIVGGMIERKMGTRNLYVVALVFLVIGMLANYVATSYTIFLVGRAVYGIGFGLAIPFIGSAIMKWYPPKQREYMNTVNGIFPFVGTVISFGLIVPISILFKGSWQQALGIWGFALIVIGVLWMLFVKKDVDDIIPEDAEEVTQEQGLYLNLWRRRDIKLLCSAFVCDFFCYSYVATILPTLLINSGGMSESQAGFWAAIAFPASGIIGCLIGGITNSTSGRRKPTMAVGQLLKLVGISVAALFALHSVWFIILGAAIFGLGNSMWMPGMYMVPMELEEMNPTRVGAAFGFISACGFVSGFVSPIAGGFLSQALIASSTLTEQAAQLAYGLKWSLFVFGFLNLIAFACILLLKETGPAAKVGKINSTEAAS